MLFLEALITFPGLTLIVLRTLHKNHMSFPWIYACMASFYDSSTWKIEETVNRIVVFSYLTVQDVCMIISFSLSFVTMHYKSCLVSFIHSSWLFYGKYKSASQNFCVFRYFFPCTYAKALTYSETLIYSKMSYVIALQVYLDSAFCIISTENCLSLVY